MATPTEKRRRGRLSLIFGVIFAALTFGAVMAYGDNVVNDVTVTVTDTFTAPGSTTVGYKVVGTGGDGQTGCNAADLTPLTLTISVPPGVSATSSDSTWNSTNKSLTFATCNDFKYVLYSSSTAGDYAINVSTSDSGTGSYMNNADFTLHVTPPSPSNTAPSVAVTGVAEGASYTKGSVPAAGCSVTDTEDGPSSFAATLSAITGPYASDGIGSQTASCDYTDTGGLPATHASATYSIVDPSAPSIGYTLNPTPPDGDNGWWVSDVTLTWTVTELQSPNSLVKTGCDNQNITADQTEQTYSCSATSAGGSASQVDVKIKRDATNPTISGAVSPVSPDGSHGWYKTAPTVTFTCGDDTSLVASCVADGSSPASDSVTLGESASAQSVGGTATDNAGNLNTASVGGLMVDLSDPTVSLWSGGINDGDSFYFGSVPAAPTCTATDAISGPDGCAVSGYSTAVGTHTLTATATDMAGRTGTATRTYQVLSWTLNGFFQPVDMGGIYNVVKNGSTVPLKFRIFAGATELKDVGDVNQLKYGEVPCASNALIDDIETIATGGTTLRYDTTGGQFVYNWKTPNQAGKCFSVIMTTQDGSSLSAYFKLK
jgi:hypothetical protein